MRSIPLEVLVTVPVTVVDEVLDPPGVGAVWVMVNVKVSPMNEPLPPDRFIMPKLMLVDGVTEVDRAGMNTRFAVPFTRQLV